MKKTKLIVTLLTICLAISTLAYGVYASVNLSFGISANVAFTVDNLFVKADAFVYNIYNQDGTTPQGSAITTSIGEKTGLASLAIIDNSDGQSIITANNIAWTIPANQPLYFNSSDLTKKITFRVEVANYTPNKDIRVTIAPADGIEATLTSLGITGTATSGTAVALNGTAQKAIATYELEVEDLTTPISSTAISLNVSIAENVPIISFNSNGGTNVTSISYLGTSINEPTEPTKTNYTFVDWYTDSACTAENVVVWPLTTVANDLTLYAKWRKNNSTVTFNSNGGSEVASLSYSGTALEVPITPTKDGNALEGWYTTSNFAPASKVTWPYTPDDDVTLYANWTTTYNTITVKFTGDIQTVQVTLTYDSGKFYCTHNPPHYPDQDTNYQLMICKIPDNIDINVNGFLTPINKLIGNDYSLTGANTNESGRGGYDSGLFNATFNIVEDVTLLVRGIED